MKLLNILGLSLQRLFEFCLPLKGGVSQMYPNLRFWISKALLQFSTSQALRQQTNSLLEVQLHLSFRRWGLCGSIVAGGWGAVMGQHQDRFRDRLPWMEWNRSLPWGGLECTLNTFPWSSLCFVSSEVILNLHFQIWSFSPLYIHRRLRIFVLIYNECLHDVPFIDGSIIPMLIHQTCPKYSLSLDAD